MTSIALPHRSLNTSQNQIRAVYDDKTIRIYQAYSNAIADSALKHRTFVSPPFKMTRMTWIKPSFLWMMYRAGWGLKDSAQSRILAIDITREGFEWALTHSCLSHRPLGLTDNTVWSNHKNATPVRIQWDPERDMHLQPMTNRTIQIGLSQEALQLYVNDWISNITDITNMVHTIHEFVLNHKLGDARAMLPEERLYPISREIEMQISA